MSAAKRIGGDWVENVDPGSGKTYYANIKTKETSWEYPAELKDQADASAGEWVEREDPASGRQYYYNTATRETSWTKPAAVTANEGGEWKEKVDPGSGKTYYYNTVTRATSWEKPEGYEDSGDTNGGDDEEEEGDSVSTSAEEPAAAENDKEDDAEKAERMKKLKAFATEQGKNKVLEKKKEDLKSNNKNDANKFADIVAAAKANYKLEDYANIYFNLNRKGLMKGKTTVSKILTWKPQPIKTSLRKLNEDLSNEAVQAFKNITGYMGDRPSKKPPMEHAKKLLRNILNAPEDLRDEIFCQLCKQTNQNTSAESCEKGWQLMLLCLATFPPSSEFAPYLKSYCAEAIGDAMPTSEHNGDEKPKVSDYALKMVEKMDKIIELGPRREIPTTDECNGAKSLKPIIIRVFFLDGTFKTIPVDSWTTAKEIDELVAEKMRIGDPKPFCCFEVSSEDEERVLDEDERILDLCALWARVQNEERAKKGKDAETEDYKFVYKTRLFFDVDEADEEAVSMMYIQAVHDVVDARYPCSEQDHITLASLQAQQEFGDLTDANKTLLNKSLIKYLPGKYLNKGREEELIERITKVWDKLKKYSSQESKLSYLDLVKSWEIYGSAYFFVEPQKKGDFPAEVVLAINAKAILVVDPETKEFLKKYPYSEVVTWGHSDKSFVIVTGNLVKQSKTYFMTDQGKEMNSLVHSYVNAILDKDEHADEAEEEE